MTKELGYVLLVYVHLLLVALWLGAGVVGFTLGRHALKRADQPSSELVTLLESLVIVGLVPRIAGALMVPVSLTLSEIGGWWDVPDPLVRASWFVGAVWVWLIFDPHKPHVPSRTARNRRWESWIRWIVCIFFVAIGSASIAIGQPVGPPWLAVKTLLFGLLFASMILVDIGARPAVDLPDTPGAGQPEATGTLLPQAIDRVRIWVWCMYVLLLLAGWLGLAGPRGVSGLE